MAAGFAVHRCPRYHVEITNKANTSSALCRIGAVGSNAPPQRPLCMSDRVKFLQSFDSPYFQSGHQDWPTWRLFKCDRVEQHRSRNTDLRVRAAVSQSFASGRDRCQSLCNSILSTFDIQVCLEISNQISVDIFKQEKERVRKSERSSVDPWLSCEPQLIRPIDFDFNYQPTFLSHCRRLNKSVVIWPSSVVSFVPSVQWLPPTQQDACSNPHTLFDFFRFSLHSSAVCVADTFSLFLFISRFVHLFSQLDCRRDVIVF